MVVHPDYRRQGIGSRLYEVRKDLVVRHNKAGIIAGGHIPGFAEHRSVMSAPEYIDRVATGELYDPTLSFQIENGFRVAGALENYLHDDATDSYSALIVWDNPEYNKSKAAR
jgi:GNAT superfamily N-acetyltransferase